MSNSPITVSEWVPRVQSGPPQGKALVPRRSRVRSVPWSSVACAAIAIGLHVTFLALFRANVIGQNTERPLGGSAAMLAGNQDTDRMEVWLIENGDSERSDPAQQLVTRPVLTKVSPSLPSEPNSRERVGAPQAEAQYLALIKDRVERRWERPPVAIGAPEFSCRVRIDQDGSGVIQAVALEECNSNIVWRLALQNAIRAASPLPLPDDAALFQPTLYIEFKYSKLRGYGS
jgi:hypothetical protein